jgi:hypothetical protein
MPTFKNLCKSIAIVAMTVFTASSTPVELVQGLDHTALNGCYGKGTTWKDVGLENNDGWIRGVCDSVFVGSYHAGDSGQRKQTCHAAPTSGKRVDMSVERIRNKGDKYLTSDE